MLRYVYMLIALYQREVCLFNQYHSLFLPLTNVPQTVPITAVNVFDPPVNLRSSSAISAELRASLDEYLEYFVVLTNGKVVN